VGQFVVLGLITGAIYSLFALGIVLMYQTTGVVNVAYGAMGVLAAYAFQALSDHLATGVAFFAVLGLSVIFGAMLGGITLPARFASVATKSVAALGLFVAVPAIVAVAWGTDIKPTPFLTRTTAFTFSGVVVTTQQAITFMLALGAAGAIYALFRCGPLGSALRAVAADVRTSQLIGLPVKRLWVVSWSIASFGAGLAAMLVIPTTSMSIHALTFVVLTPLAAALAAQLRYAGVALGAAMVAGLTEGVLAKDADWSTYRGLVPLTVALVGTSLTRSSSFANKWERV